METYQKLADLFEVAHYVLLNENGRNENLSAQDEDCYDKAILHTIEHILAELRNIGFKKKPEDKRLDQASDLDKELSEIITTIRTDAEALLRNTTIFNLDSLMSDLAEILEDFYAPQDQLDKMLQEFIEANATKGKLELLNGKTTNAIRRFRKIHSIDPSNENETLYKKAIDNSTS